MELLQNYEIFGKFLLYRIKLNLYNIDFSYSLLIYTSDFKLLDNQSKYCLI